MISRHWTLGLVSSVFGLGRGCRDMIYAETAAEVETRRKAFLRKWRLK